jgi:hypothetical protein
MRPPSWQAIQTSRRNRRAMKWAARVDAVVHTIESIAVVVVLCALCRLYVAVS